MSLLPCDCHQGHLLCDHRMAESDGCACEMAYEGPLEGQFVLTCGDCGGSGFVEINDEEGAAA